RARVGDPDTAGQPTSTTALPSAESAIEPRAPRVTLDSRIRGWELETRYGYRLKMTTTVNFADSPAFDFDMTGDVTIVPSALTPQVATLYVTIANPKFVSRLPGSQATLDKLTAEMRGAGCFVKLFGGRVAEMRFPKGFSAMAANTYRAIASALQ